MPEERSEESQRQESLQQLEDALDLPMAILAFVTLILVIARFAMHMEPPAARTVSVIITLIWWVFVLEFTVQVFLAQDRWKFVRTHWFEGITVLLPFLRVFYIFRGVQAFRALTSMHTTAFARALVVMRRGFKGFAGSLGMRSFPIVMLATAVVWMIGSLSMYFIERHAAGAVMRTFGDAAWWTVGTVTTVGTELYPVTSEGRVVATMLMIYGISVFGYLAGVLASYFVRMDAETQPKSIPPADTGD